MSEQNAKTVKVKVSPYPISVVFGVPPNISRGKIVKITMKGFLAEVENPHMMVREKFEALFTLPVLGVDYQESVVVIKTYDRLASKTEAGAVVHRLIEFHFLNLKNFGDLEAFLKQIGQQK